jgi:hypothetical protein
MGLGLNIEMQRRPTEESTVVDEAYAGSGNLLLSRRTDRVLSATTWQGSVWCDCHRVIARGICGGEDVYLFEGNDWLQRGISFTMG